MEGKSYLGVVDYIVICISLLISVGIGLLSKFKGSKKMTATEYILAGRNMTRIPVILSVVVTFLSPSCILSAPAEVYKYGFQFAIGPLVMPIGMVLASWVFIPVYFQCGVSTVYEFLEMRFGSKTRYIISAFFVVQMIFFIVLNLYGAVLAFSAVTDLSIELSVISLGVICTLYCSVGGLKAVLWTDVYQAALILVCLTSLYIAGIGDAGGISKIYNQANSDNRLEMFNFTLDFTKRYSFWGCLSRGILFGFGFYGTNQVEVQRVLSLSSFKRAKSTFQMSIIPASLSLLSCHTLGLILYSVYYHCDPVLNKEQTGIKRYDQIIPAFIVNKFSSIPGMTGICIAGIFSASLSTISSCLNSASTVTVLDFIKPLYERKRGVISDRKVVWMVKILSVVYGGASVGLSFCFLEVRSLVQLMNVFISSLEGPVLAVFLTGVLTRKGDDKSVSVALVVGYSLMTWLGFGAIHSKYLEPSLPLTTDMCPLVNVTNTEMNGTITLLQTPKLTTDTFILYKISYMWICFIGYVLTQILICFAIVVTGWKNNVIPENSVCLSPVTRFWMKKKFLNESKEIKNEFEQEDSIVLSSRQ